MVEPTKIEEINRSISLGFKNCEEIYQKDNKSQSGFYEISTQNKTILVYCEMNKGGIILIMKKQDRTTSNLEFNRSWFDYENGFGSPYDKNYWLGLNDIHMLTSHGEKMNLHLEFYQVGTDKKYSVSYEDFSVGSNETSYMLRLGTRLYGNIDDWSNLHDNRTFSTFDKATNLCPQLYSAGWWYEDCYSFCLTCENSQDYGNYDATFQDNINETIHFDRIQMLMGPFKSKTIFRRVRNQF